MTIKNLIEAEQILAEYIPLVKEITGKDITLERMKPLMQKIGNPEAKLKIIHVAGTSGKTSTAYFMAALLQESGQKVGLTVSPHIDSVTERVQINLKSLPEQQFCRYLGEFLAIIRDQKPTYFELLIAFVYWVFAQEKVDYAVIETGLGGLHDATNVAERADKVCVITDIGLDHTHVLGKTLPEIAKQKAGIIKPRNQVFMHAQSSEINQVFQSQADGRRAILNIVDDNEIDTNNLPVFQRRNWTLACATYEYLKTRDSLLDLSTEQLSNTMKVVVPARMEAVKVNDKTIIMDGAHNEQKMQAFVESFKHKYRGQKVAILMSLKQDKEYEVVLPMLKPICASIIFTEFKSTPDLPASPTNPKILSQTAEKMGFENITVEPNYKIAYQDLLKNTHKLAIITGSFYLIADVRKLML